MDVYEIIEQKLTAKESNLDEPEDVEIILFVKNLLQNRHLFFTSTKEYVVGSLYYIGFTKEELPSIYKELTSLENFQKYFPKQRTLVETDESPKK